MDDSCAVCAENLEWVAYGSCGHREVCSTCVVRLRFVLDDPRCCICKTESPIVFITKVITVSSFLITLYSSIVSMLPMFSQLLFFHLIDNFGRFWDYPSITIIL